MIRTIMTQIDIGRNLNIVRDKILQATSKRSVDLPNIVPRLVAVSKTKPKELVIQAYDAGVRDFGENYVQEIIEKGHDDEIISKCPDIKWHFIGHLQKNKVNKLLTVPNLHIIETVDSLKLAVAINSSWARNHPTEKLNIFIQVNTSGEEEKSGCKPEETSELCQQVKEQCKQLNIAGLMTIGRYDNYDDQIGINPDFKSLLSCRQPAADALAIDPLQLELSMGMSGDFEHAIEVGSTSVRVGTAIFGQHGDVKLLTTQCIVKETESLGPALFGASLIVKQYPVHQCGHDIPVTGSKCILSMLANHNSSRYIVATQDRELQEKCRLRVGVPLLYLHVTTPTLEAPSPATLKWADRRTKEQCAVRQQDQDVLISLKGEEKNNDKPIHAKKRPRAPNPLSCRRKKGKPGQGGAGLPKNEKKTKKRKKSVLEKKIRKEVIGVNAT